MEGVRTPLETVFELYQDGGLSFLYVPTVCFPGMAPKSLWYAFMGGSFYHPGSDDDSLLSH